MRVIISLVQLFFQIFHVISFHFISLPFISLHCISSHFISFHFISLHFISFHFVFISFHYIQLCPFINQFQLNTLHRLLSSFHFIHGSEGMSFIHLQPLFLESLQENQYLMFIFHAAVQVSRRVLQARGGWPAISRLPELLVLLS